MTVVIVAVAVYVVVPATAWVAACEITRALNRRRDR